MLQLGMVDASHKQLRLMQLVDRMIYEHSSGRKGSSRRYYRYRRLYFKMTGCTPYLGLDTRGRSKL